MGTLHDILIAAVPKGGGFKTARLVRPGAVTQRSGSRSSAVQLPRSPEFRRIARNHSAGAGELSARALRYLTHVVQRWSNEPPKDWRAACRAIAADLSLTQPAMGVFLRWSEEWREIARNTPATLLPARLRRWVQSQSSVLHRELPRLTQVARGRFPRARNVLTISRSEAVRRVLSALPRKRRPQRILVLESQPGGEGRIQAEELERAGLPASVVSDAGGRSLAHAVDLVLIGADTIYSDGSVVHKVGTRALVNAAHRAGTPVVVVSGRSKSVRRARPPKPLGKLFDRTPARAISEYWTDAGWIRGGHWRA